MKRKLPYQYQFNLSVGNRTHQGNPGVDPPRREKLVHHCALRREHVRITPRLLLLLLLGRQRRSGVIDGFSLDKLAIACLQDTSCWV